MCCSWHPLQLLALKENPRITRREVLSSSCKIAPPHQSTPLTFAAQLPLLLLLVLQLPLPLLLFPPSCTQHTLHEPPAPGHQVARAHKVPQPTWREAVQWRPVGHALGQQRGGRAGGDAHAVPERQHVQQGRT